MAHTEPGLSARTTRTLSKDLKSRATRRVSVILNSHLLGALVELLLTALPTTDLPRRSQGKFWRGVLAASLRRSAVESIGQHSGRGYSGRRLREILGLFTLQRLRVAAVRTLQFGLRPLLDGKLVDLAIDYTKIPYYGKPHRHRRELLRRKAEHGTANHHAWASAYVTLRLYRFTLAVVPFRPGDRLEDSVLTLVREACRCGIRIRRLLLDREYATIAVQRALQERGIAYCMAVKQSGPVNGVKAMVRRRRRKAWRGTFTWGPKKGPQVTATLTIVKRNARKGTGRTKTQYFTYASWGFRMDPRTMKDYYRTRFGVESSYRLLDVVRARTSSRNPAIRYLYVLLAFTVLNQWTVAKIAACAKRQRGPRTLDTQRLHLTHYVSLVWNALVRGLGLAMEIVVLGTLPAWWPKRYVARREVT